MSSPLSLLCRSALCAAVCRSMAALLGGYAFTIAFTVALARSLQGADWPRGDALMAAALPAFLVYLLAALRAFCAPSVARAWGETVGLALLLAALAQALERLP